MKKYIVSKDYSPITGLRYCKKTSHSGEDFYHQKLNGWFAEAVRSNEEITIILDGGEDGYGPSFLDESFGNLVYDFSLDVVKRLLKIDSSVDPDWGESLEEETFPIWEQNRINKVIFNMRGMLYAFPGKGYLWRFQKNFDGQMQMAKQ